MQAPIYLVLLHFPVTNRKGDEVTTSVTNLDISDIARSARTFGLSGYFIVTPIEEQRAMVGRILGHWGTEQSQRYHPDRVEAVSRVQVVGSFEEVKDAIRREHGQDPQVVLTDARALGKPEAVTYAQYREELKQSAGKGKPCVIVFGTGWGVSPSFYPEVHRILAPVYGPEGDGGYNHLSVRSAAAIILDRLLGDRNGEDRLFGL